MEACGKSNSVRRREFIFALSILAFAQVLPAHSENVDDPAKAALARDEPRHHLLLQNEFVRIVRVVIPPGESTRWHEHNFDYGVLFVNGTKVHVDTAANPQGAAGNTITKSFAYMPYAGKHFVHRVHNTEATINHQLAFEIIPPLPIGFAVSDRTAAPQYKLEMDNDRIRVWRLQLAPGEEAGLITQKAPGIRFVLSGDRLVETHADGNANEISVRNGDFAWLPGAASRSLTNVGATPLELLEIELK
jgi:mannose-6-phosphate isomerase-like protein (cupin superfamily)